MTHDQRVTALDRSHPSLSLRRQCALLHLSRQAPYRTPKPPDPQELALRAAIDKQYTDTPFYGTRRMVVVLVALGFEVGRKKVRVVMRAMGLWPICPKPKTSLRAPDHKVYPYLLRGLSIERPNQVWATDITYIPMPHGWLYLVAIMDWASRRVLAWRLSNTLDTAFCLEALDEALLRYGRPEIFNSDQGCQFTSEAFTSRLLSQDVKISMDGRGHCFDNIFVERLWRSVKYEEVYLKSYGDAREARRELGAYFRFYNDQRPHQSLGLKTPRDYYENLVSSACMEIGPPAPDSPVPEAHGADPPPYADCLAQPSRDG